LLLLATGCSFFDQSGAGILDSAENLTKAGNAEVRFKINLPEETLASIRPTLRANTSPSVLFKLGLVFPGQDGNSQTMIMQRRVAVDADGKADVTFSGVPETPVVGQMLIDGGSLGGKSDFHGAADLVAGENIIELAPVGSGHASDIAASLMLDLMKVSELIKTAPAKLVSSINNTVQTTINRNLSGFELYQQAMTDFMAAKPFVGLTYTSIAVANDGGLTTEAGSTLNWSKTPTELWDGIADSSGLLANRVLRQGFSELTPPLVVFKDSSHAKFALALLDPADGRILKYFIADGTSLSHLSAVVAEKDYVIAGAAANGLPVILRWNTNVSVYSGWPVSADVAWANAFPGTTAHSGLNFPAVEQLSFVPGVNDMLHAVVRDPASLMLGTYLVSVDGNIITRQAPPAVGEEVLWPLTVFPGNNSTTIHWDDIPNADYYTLYWSLTEEVPTSGETANAINRPTRPFVHTDLQGEVTYYYRLTWTIGGEEKGPSRVASATTWVTNSQDPLYRIIYYGNKQDSGLPPMDSGYYKTGAKVNILDNIRELTRTGYNFSGWNTAADGSGTTYQSGSEFTFSNANLTLYALWRTPGFKLTYEGNGNTAGTVPVDAGSYDSNSQATVAANSGNLSKTGLVFGGWNTAADGSGTTYKPADQITMTADTTLYALWQSAFRVTYNANGGTGTTPEDSTTYLTGAEVTVKSNSGGLARSGFIFSGWNTAADRSGTSYQPADKFNIGSADVILYAKWIPDTTYAVTYNGNGNDGGTVPADSSYLEEAIVTVAANSGNLTNDGAPFLGWNTKADGTGEGYAPGTTFIMGTAAVTLYAQWQEFAGGTGTEADPYLVANAVQLNRVRNHPDKHFKQTADIDLGVAPFNGGEGWEPTGQSSPVDKQFTGTYNGNSKKILNLYINRPTQDVVGLFGYISKSVIKDLTIENADVSGNNAVGALVGAARDVSTITTCNSSGMVKASGTRAGGLAGSATRVSIHGSSSTAAVSGTVMVGGFIGDVNDGYYVDASQFTECNAEGSVIGSYSIGGFAGSIDGGSEPGTSLQTCTASGDVSGDTHSIGGLVGMNGGYAEIAYSSASGKVTALPAGKNVGGLVGANYGEINHSYSSGVVEGGSGTGGLVGQAYAGIISKCYATGAVISDNDWVGGLLGIYPAGSTLSISDSYATGNVTGRNKVGGLVGNWHITGTIERCYATGHVSGGTDQPDVGGLCGFSDGTITASYWDVETTGKSTSSGGGTGLTTANMKKSASYSGWDFNTVWAITEDVYYPSLRP
jgi:uncharacterized repeat protein (TIGR02543 family)